MLLKRRTGIFVLVVSLLTPTGCSLQKMTGDTMVGYTEEHVFPYLMASPDVGMGCELGVSMGGFLMSFSRVDVDTHKASIPSLISAGMCAEAKANETELRRLRALHAGNSAEAKDATIEVTLHHELAARRNHKAFLETVAAFKDPNKGCPEFDGNSDQALYLLGLASGLLAVVHDRQSGVRANVPMDIPRAVERGVTCLDNEKWWGMPEAIRAAIWLSIPGVAPEGEDPWAALEDAAAIGDKSGVGMARALYIQVAGANGREDLMCAGVEKFNQARAEVERKKDWILLDEYSLQLVRHETDKTWSRAEGYRTPDDPPVCYTAEEPDESLDELGGDDLLEDIDESPAPESNDQPDTTEPGAEDSSGGSDTAPATDSDDEPDASKDKPEDVPSTE